MSDDCQKRYMLKYKKEFGDGNCKTKINMSAIKEHYHEEICKGQEEAAKSMRTLKPSTFKRKSPKPGRNQICPCGSGKKFKNCHEIEYRIKLQKHVMEVRAEQQKIK
jgi:preprotein translocase subunit SecA